MRLPADTVLLLGEAADPELQRVWREEGLAVAPLTAELEAGARRLIGEVEAAGGMIAAVAAGTPKLAIETAAATRQAWQ